MVFSDTLILIKTMGQRKHFGNPFKSNETARSSGTKGRGINRCASMNHEGDKYDHDKDLY